jgi:hypothetical protein
MNVARAVLGSRRAINVVLGGCPILCRVLCASSLLHSGLLLIGQALSALKIERLAMETLWTTSPACKLLHGLIGTGLGDELLHAMIYLRLYLETW